MNRYKFIIPKTDQYIDLPIEMKWDFYGRDDSISVYEDEVINELTGNKEDFEILRFAHAPYSSNTKTDIKYKFYFFSVNGQVPPNPTLNVTTSSPSDWICSYIPEGFNVKEIYYYVKPFTKSFFKLDFYDSPDTSTQKNYFTIILPVQQGLVQTTILNPSVLGSKTVSIKRPYFVLDYVGDKEGFFVYWLKKRDFIDLSTFYMTAKFFDARNGVFIKMMTVPQTSLSSQTNFNPNDYFYYKLELDYNLRTYRVVNKTTGVRVGTNINPISWYEYVNP